MQKVIEVNNLTKTYPIARPKDGIKTFQAIKGTSFYVEKGEIFGILGPNGAGKTTTLEIIEGLKQQTSGEVKVLGLNNLNNIEEIKKRIGVQLQSSQYLPYLSLGELLDLFASLYDSHVSSRPRSAADERRDPSLSEPKGFLGSDALARNDKHRLLQLVGLEEKISELPKSLSGGQQQRFTIASSLVNSPEILFLDEPTTGLDPHARREMWKLIKSINQKGITIVLTTHYMEEAEFLCHRVAIMDSGKILEIDEPRKLIDKLSETTQISFFSDKNLDENIFANVSEVKKVYANYPKIIIEISSLDKISTIINILKTNNVPFSGFTVKTATLEDVYLKLTGKEYEE